MRISLALKQDLFIFNGKIKYENTHFSDMIIDFSVCLLSDSGFMYAHQEMPFKCYNLNS